jgi:uncharacterized protein (DUF1810 family)
MNDRHNLKRFLEAQDPVYAQVCDELRRGAKRSHWMWFIFPQISGLGSSERAQYFAIPSIEEARAYLAQAVLGRRLEECTRLVMSAENRTLSEIFGHPDDAKFRSCMTLFAHADPSKRIFQQALDHFGEDEDPATLRVLRAAPF